LGIYAETLNAWVGPYEQLAAHAATPLASKRDASAAAAAAAGVAATRIGRVEAGCALRVVVRSGAEIESAFASFDHFRS
jgi:thiamine monophosphate kinase